MTLLAATALNANNQIVLLAFALVPVENKEWWKWFLNFFGEAFDEGGINGEDCNVVFLSDRGKGLEMALNSEFPAAFHGMCVHHLSQNVKARYSAHAASFTFKLARAKTRTAFELINAELEASSAGAARYLNATDHSRWARFAFPYPCFGHLTSNIAESLNAILSDTRRLPPI